MAPNVFCEIGPTVASFVDMLNSIAFTESFLAETPGRRVKNRLSSLRLCEEVHSF